MKENIKLGKFMFKTKFKLNLGYSNLLANLLQNCSNVLQCSDYKFLDDSKGIIRLVQ